MAKHRPDIEDTLASELYDHFLRFIDDKGGIPLERAFWGWLIRTNQYTQEALPEWTFRYHFARLVTEGWIEIEKDTRCLLPKRKVQIEVDRD